MTHALAIPSLSTSALPRPASSRLFYLDTLRIVLTILVILHHVAQAYGPTGGSWPVQEPVRAAILGPFFMVNRSFFMSLFFMISGYFMVSAYDRHGFGAFIRSRAVRLGIPTLLFGCLMMLVQALSGGFTRWDNAFNAGHLWYLEHVLIFSVVYALWRRFRDTGRRTLPAATSVKPPSLQVIIPVMVLIAALSFAIRLWSPIDRWMNLLGFIRVAFADVPRDLSFFIFGALAFRRRWFESYPTRKGIAWLAVGLTAAAAWYAWVLLIPHPASTRNTLAYAITFPVWEELLCFGMSIGLLVLFRQIANSQGRFGKMLAASQYSAYFWQLFFILPIQDVFLALALSPIVKFIAVAFIVVPLIFFWSWLMLKLRVVRAVL
jgi:peptidoglycan/LPS O-acetylase OafA/YrhL